MKKHLENQKKINSVKKAISVIEQKQALQAPVKEVYFSFTSELDRCIFISDSITNYGLEKEPFLQNPNHWRKTIHPEELALTNSKLEELEKMNEIGFISRITTPIGVFRIAVRIWKQLDQSGGVVGYHGRFSDTVKSINQEINLEKSEAKAKRLSDILQIISEAQLSLFTNSGFENILQSILKKLIRLTGDKMGFICEVIEDQTGKRKMTPHAFAIAGNEEFIKKNFKMGMSFSNYDSLYGHSLSTGKVYISNNTSEEQPCAGVPKGHPSIMRFMGIPVWKNDEFLGLIGLANRDTPYSCEDLEFLSPIVFSYGNLIKFTRILNEKRELELQKLLAQQRYKLLEENISDVICLLNKDLIFEYISPSVLHVTGYSPDCFIGKSLKEVLDMMEVVEKSSGKSRKLKRILSIFHMDTKKPIQLEIISKVIYDQDGGVLQVISTARDVSDKEHMYREIQKSLRKEKELNSLKSRFISMTSHEFRTPLSIIMSSNELLNFFSDEISNGQLISKMKHHINRIYDQVKRLTSVIDDVLIIEKHENKNIRINMETFELLDFLGMFKVEVQQNIAQSRDFQVTTPDQPRTVQCDPAKLRHILRNLIENAFKYSHNSHKQPELKLSYEGIFFEIKVKDYGLGIPKSDQGRIFESFYRGSNVSNIKGTGLGLNIVHELVLAMNGKLDFESIENVGTTFSLRFPYNFNYEGVE
ncbi:ATP-binding protein [Belliella marina]|uniref:histidine kinase n=1 Tax=Belliella marina TaxID=1644146 RepID=A0ABW4VMR8_9BACT